MEAQTTSGMTDSELERARKRSDKKVMEDAVAECANCGGTGHVITYYDTLANDRTCINCRHTY